MAARSSGGRPALNDSCRNVSSRFTGPKTPQERSDRCHPLKGDLATVTIQGVTMQRWQYEVTSGGRIWYAVGSSVDKRNAGTVFLVRVAPGHPNETAKQFR